MKRHYEPPNILFESFTLSATLTAGCSIKISTQSVDDCGMSFGVAVVFTQNVLGCDRKVEDGSPVMNGMCYHVPVEGMALFNS